MQDSKISICVICKHMCLQLISNGFILLTVLLNIERNTREWDFSFRAISAFKWLTAYHLLFIKTVRFGVLVFPIPCWAWDLSYKNVLKFSLDKTGTTITCVGIFYSILVHTLSTQGMLYTFFPNSDFSPPKVFNYRRCFFTPGQARDTTTFRLSLLFSLWLLILNEIIRCPRWTSWLSGLKFDINMVRNLPEEEVAVA